MTIRKPKTKTLVAALAILLGLVFAQYAMSALARSLAVDWLMHH